MHVFTRGICFYKSHLCALLTVKGIVACVELGSSLCKLKRRDFYELYNQIHEEKGGKFIGPVF